MENDIILSLCISTYYDRGEILQRTINSIVSDPDFDKQVELVIIDNGSIDNTSEICKEYMSKYSNVHYSKNEKNIGNRNFTKVLKTGKGFYVKFLNDTQTFKPGKLGKMKRKIVEYKDTGNNILFIRKTEKHVTDKILEKVCPDKRSLLESLSYFTSWSGNFGSYSSFFNNIEDPDRAADIKFPQVDWIYSLANDRPTVIIVDDFYNVETTFKKGSWNFLDVFTTYYFKTLRLHFSYGLSFEKEKWRLFKYHLVPFCYTLTSSSSNYDYDNSNAIKILMKYYWYNILAYFYFIIYYSYQYIRK